MSTTALYSIMHFLTDSLSAFAFFARFSRDAGFYESLLLYNFAAFALQLPIGAFSDLIAKALQKRSGDPSVLPRITAVLGVLCTLAGALTHPVVLGLGNALFHVGGGIGTVLTDRKRNFHGRVLGVFVAPGALGLFFGKLAGKSLPDALYVPSLLAFLLLFSILSVLLFTLRAKFSEDTKTEKTETVSDPSRMTKEALFAVIAAFLVVVLRSYVGMSVRFSWNDSFVPGLLAVLFVVLGKAAGGFFAAKFSAALVSVFSLAASSVFFFFGNIPAFGLSALFFFNMTMPITLYLITERFPDLPGTAFGLLTFALFLGFLPVYLEMPAVFPANLTGTVGAALSIALLLPAVLLLAAERRRSNG